MIYLSSDLHLCHNNDFVWKERGFSSVDGMNAAIIKNFNSIVKDDDILYLLGDCCMGLNEDSIPLLTQLKGHKFLIIGNHDTSARIDEYYNKGIFENIQFGDRLKYKKRIFLLSHYPMLVGNASNEKVWNLHGHTHQKHKFGSIPQCYHVGVDSHDCFPISLEKIYEEIKSNNAEN